MKKTFKTILVLLLVLLPALFFGLGERPVYKIQEVRIAETAREMIESGDWLVPRFNGELRLQKPPLPYWVTAASYHVGGVGAGTTRWPAALAGLCLSLLLWLWGRREVGEDAACTCVLVLVTSFLGLRYFRSGEADALLLLCISVACKLGFDILSGRHGAWRRILFGLALGLGFLSKGPAGVAIPLLTVLLASLVERRRGGVRAAIAHFFSLPGVAALLLVAFGWYAWIIWRLPEASQLFFGRQIDETFITGNHPKPIWWYLSNCVEFFAPWSVLVIPAGIMAYRRRATEMPALIRFAWSWLAVVFVLLTATVNKQTQYALLFAPPLALILGHYLGIADGGFRRLNRILFGVFCVAAIAGIGFALRKSADLPQSLIWLALPLVQLAFARMLGVHSPSWPVVLVAGLVSTAFLYSDAHLSKEPRKLAAQSVMSDTAGYSPLFQAGPKPGAGELSFYAGRVVRPVDAEELPELLDRYPNIWLVGEKLPELPNTSVVLVKQIDELRLVKLSRRR